MTSWYYTFKGTNTTWPSHPLYSYSVSFGCQASTLTEAKARLRAQCPSLHGVTVNVYRGEKPVIGVKLDGDTRPLAVWAVPEKA